MTTQNRFRIALVLALGLSTAACSNEESTTTDMGTVVTDMGGTDAGSVDSGGADLGATDMAVVDVPAHVADWSCAGSVTWPAATVASISLTGQISDALTHAALAGVSGTVCPDRNDQACEGAISAGISLADGTITTSLDTGMGNGGNGYFGYFKLAKDGYMDVLAFTYRPLAMELPTPPTEQMFSPLAISGAAAMLGVTVDSEKGILNVRVRDCVGEYVSGATVAATEAIDGATQYYAVGSTIVVADSDSETDESGVTGFVNVPPGSYTLEVTAPGHGVVGRVSLFVLANTMTHTYLAPTPLAL